MSRSCGRLCRKSVGGRHTFSCDERAANSRVVDGVRRLAGLDTIAGDGYPTLPVVKPKLWRRMTQWRRSPAVDVSASVEDGSSDVAVYVCACVCVCGRTTMLIERLLHYYNRQEPPMKGLYIFQTSLNLLRVVLSCGPLHEGVNTVALRPSVRPSLPG